MSGDRSKRNSVSRPNDSKSKDKSKVQKDGKKGKDNGGDEEMTVVVPPSKTNDADQNGDVTMNGMADEKEEAPIDPKVKAVNGKASVSAQRNDGLTVSRYQEQPGTLGTSSQPIRPPIYPEGPALDTFHSKTAHGRTIVPPHHRDIRHPDEDVLRPPQILG